MGRLASISASPLIRTFAQGAAQSAVKPVANFLAPAVPVPTSNGRYKVYTAKNRFKVPNTLRGMGGRAVRIGFDASDATMNCEPNAIDFPIDNLEKLEGDSALESMVKYGATLIADVATLSHELTVITKALASVGAGTDSNFASGAVDPIAVLDASILAVTKAAKNGADVKVLFGASAFLNLKNNSQVKGRFTVGGKGQGTQLIAPTLDDISALLWGNPKCMLSKMVQDTAAEGLAESISFLLDTGIIIFASNDNPTTLDPSFMKTFRLDGQWMVPGSYETEDQRGEVLKMDWSEDVEVTNSAAAARINGNAS